MKKAISALLLILVLLAMFPMTALADVGPKPSVVIDFKKLDGETYYATLLSSVKSTGPFSALGDGSESYVHYQPGDEGYEIFLKFLEYEDADGFYFLQYFQDCSQMQQFSWTYYPPQEFKILLYFPETDRFVSGERCARYAFVSYFTAEVTGLDPVEATADKASIITERSYDYTAEILSMIARILVTIAIELGIALLFGFRGKRQFRLIVLVNAVTQITLNVALNIINYYSGFMAFVIFYALLEIGVVIVEAVLYSVYLKRFSEKPVPGWKPFVYALIANVVSFALGLVLA